MCGQDLLNEIDQYGKTILHHITTRYLQAVDPNEEKYLHHLFLAFTSDINVKLTDRRGFTAFEYLYLKKFQPSEYDEVLLREILQHFEKLGSEHSCRW